MSERRGQAVIGNIRPSEVGIETSPIIKTSVTDFRFAMMIILGNGFL